MIKFIWQLFLDECGGTLSITRKSANTLITASGFNTNFDQIEAEVNSLDTTNYTDDSVTAAKLAADVVRSGYGLIQHTDGSLYVDLSDTNPSLEITDGGVRAKVDDSSIERASGGLQVKALGVTNAMLAGSIPASKLLDTYLTATSHDLVARHPLSVGGTGETTAAGAYAVIAAVGSWVARSAGSNYQAATDGFIVAYGNGNEGYIITAYTDSAGAPTTVRSKSGSTSGTTGGWWTVFTPVKKNDYYRVDCTGSLTGYYWIPMGN